MKKRTLFLLPTVTLIGILLFILPSLLRGYCLFYDTRENVDGLSVAVNRAGRVCFVGNYSWDGSEERISHPPSA